MKRPARYTFGALIGEHHCKAEHLSRVLVHEREEKNAIRRHTLPDEPGHTIRFSVRAMPVSGNESNAFVQTPGIIFIVISFPTRTKNPEGV